MACKMSDVEQQYFHVVIFLNLYVQVYRTWKCRDKIVLFLPSIAFICYYLLCCYKLVPCCISVAFLTLLGAYVCEAGVCILIILYYICKLVGTLWLVKLVGCTLLHGSNWLILLLTCFRNLKLFLVNGDFSQTRQTHNRDVLNILLTSSSRSVL